MGTKISDDIDPGDAKEVVRHAVRLASRTRNLSRSIDVSTLVNSLPDAVADFYEPSAVDYIFAIKELSPSDASNKVLKSGRVVLPRGMMNHSFDKTVEKLKLLPVPSCSINSARCSDDNGKRVAMGYYVNVTDLKGRCWRMVIKRWEVAAGKPSKTVAKTNTNGSLIQLNGTCLDNNGNKISINRDQHGNIYENKQVSENEETPISKGLFVIENVWDCLHANNVQIGDVMCLWTENCESKHLRILFLSKTHENDRELARFLFLSRKFMGGCTRTRGCLKADGHSGFCISNAGGNLKKNKGNGSRTRDKSNTPKRRRSMASSDQVEEQVTLRHGHPLDMERAVEEYSEQKTRKYIDPRDLVVEKLKTILGSNSVYYRGQPTSHEYLHTRPRSAMVQDRTDVSEQIIPQAHMYRTPSALPNPYGSAMPGRSFQDIPRQALPSHIYQPNFQDGIHPRHHRARAYATESPINYPNYQANSGVKDPAAMQRVKQLTSLLEKIRDDRTFSGYPDRCL